LGAVRQADACTAICSRRWLSGTAHNTRSPAPRTRRQIALAAAQSRQASLTATRIRLSILSAPGRKSP